MKLLNLSKRLGVFFFLFLSLTACSSLPKSPVCENPVLDWPYERFRINQEFGKTPYGSYYASGSHWGLDLTHGAGASIRPIAEGFVVAVGTQSCSDFPDPACNGGQGNWVLIEHPQLKTRSFYGHLRERSALKPGQRITREDVIGQEGRSGRIFNLDGTLAGERSETHLHLSMGNIQAQKTRNGELEIRIGELINPREILPEVSKRGR